MAKNSVNDWDTDPALNLDLADISLVEGVTVPSAVNNLFRTMMAQIKAFFNPASASDYLANVPDRILITDEINATGAPVALTDGATINWNMALGYNASVTIAGNRLVAAPTNGIAGRSGFLKVTQDAAGSRTLSWASGWKFVRGTPPVLSLSPGTVDYVLYICTGPNTAIVSGILKAVA